MIPDPFETEGWTGEVRWTAPEPVPPRWYGTTTGGGRTAVVSGRLPAAGSRALPHAVQQLTRTLADQARRRGYDVLLVDPMDDAPDLPGPVDLLVGELRMFDAVLPALRADAPAVWVGSRPHWTVERDAVQRRRDEVRAKKGFEPFVPPWEEGRWNGGADRAAAVLAFAPHSYTGRAPYVGEIGNSYLRALAAQRVPDRPGRGFLWLGTGSFVRKGLDLALDVFAGRRDLDLYVAGPLHWADQRDFVWHYRDELFHRPSVHPIGLTPPATRPWQDVVRSTGFVLLPSCAEGVAGAVLDGMVSGLVPVVTPACGVPVGDIGITIEEPTESAVRAAVETAAGLSDVELRERSAAARAFALEHYSARAVGAHVERHLAAVLASGVPAPAA